MRAWQSICQRAGAVARRRPKWLHSAGRRRVYTRSCVSRGNRETERAHTHTHSHAASHCSPPPGALYTNAAASPARCQWVPSASPESSSARQASPSLWVAFSPECSTGRPPHYRTFVAYAMLIQTIVTIECFHWRRDCTPKTLLCISDSNARRSLLFVGKWLSFVSVS